MASPPCNCWTHIADSLSPSPPSPSSSLPQTPTNTKSIEHVWKELKLASLSNCSLDLNNDSSSVLPSDSSFLMQTPPTLLCLSSSSAFQKQSCSSVSSESNCKKRGQQEDHHDQRHKRMIKNRESALRSRARKQAYYTGLEIRIARLTEENFRLQKQLEELQLCLSSSVKSPRRSVSA